MSYRRALIIRWSRRDRLAALVVAITVGFLVGTALLVVAGGAQTTAIAAGFDSPGEATVVDSPAVVEAPDQAVVTPFAVVETPDGKTTLAVGVPAGTDRTFGDSDRRLQRSAETTLGDMPPGSTPHRLAGSNGEATVTVTERSSSIVPDRWYLTSPETIDQLGASGAFIIDGGSRETQGLTVPLRSALPFFSVGTDEALQLVAILVGASGLLVGVTVYSVTRMSVIDRREAIQVARATGGTPRSILAAFLARAGLLAAVGAAVGYAIGVIVVAGAVNIAVVIGLPTSLDPRITADVAVILAPIVGTIPVIGTVAGGLAAWPAVRKPPAAIGRTKSRGFPVLSPRVLQPQVIIPTTATLAAFAVFALLFFAGVGVLVPMLGGGEAVVTQPGSTHPVSSQVPAAYTAAFESQGIAASAEILLFGVVDNRAIPIRGAIYDDFAAVSDATIETGRPPAAPDEAILGTGAAQTLEVTPGDDLPLGGSTRVGLTRVTVVGTFTAPPPYNDHVIVSLPTARHLSGVGDRQVNLVRGTALPEPTGDGLVVTGISPSEQPIANEPIEVVVRVTNESPNPVSDSITVRLGNQTEPLPVKLQPASETTVTVTFEGVSAGQYQLTVADAERTITVPTPAAIQFDIMPERLPPNSTPLLRVVDVRGTPIENATITANGTTVTTDADGTARLSVGDPGAYEIQAIHDGESTTASLTVADPEADGKFTNIDTATTLTDLDISPSPADILTQPTADLLLQNIRNVTVVHEVTLTGPGGTTTETLSLKAGEAVTITRGLEQQPPGEYTVTAALNGTTTDRRDYTVRGDERLAAALATRGQEVESTFEQAIEVAFGNIQILAATLVALAAMMAIGATAAAFADAVYAERQALGIRRATGASPWLVARLVLGDALRLGSVAAVLGTLLGVGALWLLDLAGVLAAFGVRLLPGLSPEVIIGVGIAALAVAVFGAAVATVGLLRDPPSALLASRSTTSTESTDPFEP